MLLLLLGICIVFFVVGALIYNDIFEKFDVNYEIGEIFMGCSGIIGAFVLIAVFVVGIITTQANVLDEKIAMYQEENTKIEQQISDMVTQYQKYETDIFTECTPESAMTLVSLYPELKSDTLVQKQISVYTNNNEKIKELKEQEIDGDVYRWWLYFGGNKD